MRVIDMVGKPFGNLIVIKRAENSLNGQAQWWVRCGCPNPIEFVVLGNNLRRGNTAGCPHIKSDRGRKTMVELRNTINDEIESELAGNQFGDLVVNAKWDVTKQGVRWLCKCVCGRDDKVLVRTAALKSGSRTKCKLCSRDAMKLSPGQGMRNHLLRIYKAAALRREYCWELIGEQFDAITQSNCHYCGQSPSERKHNKRFNGAYKCNGIDRKDSTIGYITSNVVPCCKTCNYAKRTLGYGEFIEYLKRAGRFQLEINTMEAFT